MPTLRHCNSSVLQVIFDKQLHQCSTSKMKISKAPELLKKAATVFKVKTEVLQTRLLVLASLRRRMALVGAVSRRIQSLVSLDDRDKQARVGNSDKALVLHKQAMVASGQGPTAAADHRERDGLIDLSEVAIFDEDDHEYPDWTHSLFEDDGCDNVDRDGHDDHERYGVLDALEEPSIIDVIRRNREVEGLEFNMDEEIDEACNMFIRRFRKRMLSSF